MYLALRILFIISLFVLPVNAQNTQQGDLNTNTQDSVLDSNNTTNNNTTNYNGAGSSSDSPPTAVAPSLMSSGQESCLVSRSAAVQYSIIGFSAGAYVQDKDCNRRRDAKVLKDLGMNIAAVSLMCSDTQVWRSMFDSGTPCPLSINGRLLVGKAAYYTMKKEPLIFIPDFKERKEYYNLVLQLEKPIDDEESTSVSGSISDRFRTSKSRPDNQ